MYMKDKELGIWKHQRCTNPSAPTGDHTQLIVRKTVAEVPLAGLSFLLGRLPSVESSL